MVPRKMSDLASFMQHIANLILGPSAAQSIANGCGTLPGTAAAFRHSLSNAGGWSPSRLGRPLSRPDSGPCDRSFIEIWHTSTIRPNRSDGEASVVAEVGSCPEHEELPSHVCARAAVLGHPLLYENASAVRFPARTHDSGSLRFARPSTFRTCIYCTAPV
jgi:hypothetical protein